MKNILVINSGSSSIKYQLLKFDEAQNHQVVMSGIIEEIGNKDIKHHQSTTHLDALNILCSKINALLINEPIDAVGHRVVHGGTRFIQATIMTLDTLEELKLIDYLAPLHNPANIVGIEVAMKLLPNALHVAIFDTAFHYTMPPEAHTYAIPPKLASQLAIKRYGFHGTSYQYITQMASVVLNKPVAECQLIILHLGNGASSCAIKGGVSIDTSMGMTPLEGLVMGSRSGDIDPAIPIMLTEKYDGDYKKVSDILNKQSGLKGLCNLSDMRELEKELKLGNKAAELAFKIMLHRLLKYIGAYFALLPKLDAIIFTGGIGENSSLVVNEVLTQITHLGIEVDLPIDLKAYDNAKLLSSANSKVKAFAIRTNEELAIARQVYELL